MTDIESTSGMLVGWPIEERHPQGQRTTRGTPSAVPKPIGGSRSGFFDMILLRDGRATLLPSPLQPLKGVELTRRLRTNS